MLELYHSQWQNNRIRFLLSLYGCQFFKNKNILELGAFNGYIGNFFSLLGANVTCVEGKEENIESIKENYPNIKVIKYDLDTPDWTFGTFDIIINFGLLYHLEKHHRENITNCIKNCEILFLESVVFDSNEPVLFFRKEEGIDQSLSGIGGTPSTSYVENILKENECDFDRYDTPSLNSGKHCYDWIESNSKVFNDSNRRFWIIKKR